jgi:hypothetical protein
MIILLQWLNPVKMLTASAPFLREKHPDPFPIFPGTFHPPACLIKQQEKMALAFGASGSRCHTKKYPNLSAPSAKGISRPLTGW